jgi:outer membrane protein assembly factor BamE (lipoprotein component of BamABCDE complex)
MRKLGWTMLAVLTIAAASSPAQEAVANGRTLQVDREHTQWIDQVMRSIATIKPGMTRKDLRKVLGEEGGVSTRTRRRYAYIHCPHIKVDVDFAPVEDPNATSGKVSMEENPDDRIVKVSQPFLQYSIMD